MENFNNTDKKMRKVVLLLLLATMVLFSKSYGATDTTLFRIHSLQDTVDAGDTIDVDLFIGDADHLADSIKEFEIEIEYDLDICDKNHIDFNLDSSSLAAFFGTSFSDVTTISSTTGNVNIKVNCNTIGSGTARIGRIKYIVQDNVNGRQLLRFDFLKISAKRLSGGGGNSKPVKTLKDSVEVIKGYRQLQTSIRANATRDKVKIYPNPFSDYLQIDGDIVQQYELLKLDGSIVASVININRSGTMEINIKDLDAGYYLLQLKINDEWKSYHIMKQ